MYLQETHFRTGWTSVASRDSRSAASRCHAEWVTFRTRRPWSPRCRWIFAIVDDDRTAKIDAERDPGWVQDSRSPARVVCKTPKLKKNRVIVIAVAYNSQKENNFSMQMKYSLLRCILFLEFPFRILSLEYFLRILAKDSLFRILPRSSLRIPL